MRRILSLLVITSVFWSCDSSNDEVQVDVKEKTAHQDISFENYYQKISYAIGLDHGTAGKAIYSDERLQGKFNIEEIQNGLVDYLSTNPLKILPNSTDSLLALYLNEDGSVDTTAVSMEIGSYAIGVNEAIVLISTFVARGIDQEIDPVLLVKGIEDGLHAVKSNNYSLEEAQSDIATYYAEVNLKNGEAFLQNNSKKQGVVTTASGLQYQVFESGSGSSPNPADSVVVHYTGRYINGQEFESSIPSGKPIRITLLDVIKGWTEGLELMSKGAKYRFFVPSELAYGKEGFGQIEPNSALVFDIELLEIIKYVPNY